MLVNLSNVSHYSLRQGFSRPHQIVKLSKDYGYDSVGLIDINTVSGVVPFLLEAKEAKLKPVIGSRVTLYTINDPSEIVLIVRNNTGWKNLIKILTLGHQKKLEFQDLKGLGEGLIVIGSSHLMLSPLDWSKEYKKVFDELFIPNNAVLAKELNAHFIYINSSYYPKRENREDLQILICTEYKNTLKRVQPSLKLDDKRFFDDSQSFHIKKPNEVLRHDGREFLVSLIDDDLGVLHRPSIPEIQAGLPFRELCYKGLSDRGIDLPNYRERLEEELKVLEGANLGGYFLICRDVMVWAKEKMGWLCGPSRGSAGGCLTAYVLRITEIDPIPHDLLFTRFYNGGRNTKDRVSLPDVDMDFPKYHREEVIEYLRNKYGNDKVSKIATFGRLMGAGAITEVLSKHEAASNFEIKKISKRLPMEARVEDKMKDFFSEDEDRSIIKWVLHNDPDLIKEYCHWDEKEQRIVGPMAAYFEQAIRIEGTFRNMGTHASGIFISNIPIVERCPLVHSKGDDLVAAFEMDPAKDVGLVKFDILGTVVFDKLMLANKFIIDSFKGKK